MLRGAVVLLIFSGLTSCKLWTIRPIESKATTATTQTFSADSYVDSIWESKLVPTVTEKAIDLATLLTALERNMDEANKQYGVRNAEGPAHFMVRGEGVVTRVNSDSPHRTLTIRLPKYAGKTEVTMQIGPVFRGTALRDAVGFIKFNEFTNQLQFAEVSTKLHERVKAQVVRDDDVAKAQGKPISFAAAFTLNEREKIMLTPVKLAWGGKAQ
jgi:predicted lipoprotein